MSASAAMATSRPVRIRLRFPRRRRRFETASGLQVLEVSAFGGFRGSRDALGLDLAERYARYAVERLRQGR